MHGHLDWLLRRWGMWSVRIDMGGIGYPDQCPMFRLAPPSDCWQSTPPQDLTAYDLTVVGASVERLPDELKAVCVLTYRQGKSLRDICHVVCVSYETVRTRLHRAKALVDLMVNATHGARQ